MRAGADDARLLASLNGVARRRTVRALARGVAVGAGVAALVLVLLAVAQFVAPGALLGAPLGASFGSPMATGLGLLAAGVLVGGGAALLRLDRGPIAAAREVERGSPASRNLVRTATELALHPERRPASETDPNATPAQQRQERARAAVLADAARFMDDVEQTMLVPLGRPLAAALGVTAVGVAVVFALMPSTNVAGVASDALERGETIGSAGEVQVRVHLHPPAWIGGEPRIVENPEQIEALAGSRLELEVGVPVGDGGVTRVLAETVEGESAMESDGPGTFRSSHTLEADGFLAIEGRGADGEAQFRRLVGITALPDEAPVLRLTAPGRDLLLADGDSTLELVVEASDDHALSELELVYTRVNGFGEVFEFLEGSIPLRVERAAPGRWTGRATWDLRPLALERGEFAVYHARGRDRRPGAPDAVSDSWMVEVVGSEAALAGGFAGDDETTRYGMSQQMVLVLMERLEAGRDTLSDDDLLSESRILAAAQRRVRAEFVFMLGGELEDDAHVALDDGLQDPAALDPDLVPFDPLDPDDPTASADLHEEAHARADQEAAEGRLAQQGRQELSRAVLAMAQTATYLERSDLGPARAAGQVALDHLQRAFSSSRYILRAMSEREELDDARRLSGSTAEAVPDRRPGVLPDADPEVVELRSVLAAITPPSAAGDAALLARSAARVLAVQPADPEHFAIAASLRSAADGADEAGGSGVDAHVSDAIAGLVALLRDRMAPAPPSPRSLELRRLEADILRTPGGGG